MTPALLSACRASRRRWLRLRLRWALFRGARRFAHWSFHRRKMLTMKRQRGLPMMAHAREAYLRERGILVSVHPPLDLR